MEHMAKRLINGIFSVVTTFMLMAAPVAAIIYASEPMEANNTYIVRSNAAYQESQMAAKLDELGTVINVWKPGILDDTIVSMVMNIRDPK